MITKTENPNDALDLFEIELRARALRAQAMRNFSRRVSAWVSGRTEGLGQAAPQPAKG